MRRPENECELASAGTEWFKERVHRAGGGNYQTLMNHALREYINDTEEPLEETLRRVLREELHNAR